LTVQVAHCTPRDTLKVTFADQQAKKISVLADSGRSRHQYIFGKKGGGGGITSSYNFPDLERSAYTHTFR
jgi:hypothetical protein